MKNYKKHFLRFAEERDALKFGEFTLKSGRKSPYFFNAGTFHTGEALSLLCGCDHGIRAGIRYVVRAGL